VALDIDAAAPSSSGAPMRPMGIRETRLVVNKQALIGELRRYMPAIQPGDLRPGPSGVRAQAVSRDGRLIDDFMFSEAEHLLHVRNAPSPAATACLAIAEMIADRLDPGDSA